MKAVRKIGVEAGVVRVGLSVTEGVDGVKVVPDAIHAIDFQLCLPLEPDRTTDVSGVVVYELPLRVWPKEPGGRARELATALIGL